MSNKNDPAIAKTQSCIPGYIIGKFDFFFSVGEPLSKSTLDWFLKCNNCKFVDTWWQTGKLHDHAVGSIHCCELFYPELGGIALIIDHEHKDLPEGNFPAKPFFGVEPAIIDSELVILILYILLLAVIVKTMCRKVKL